MQLPASISLFLFTRLNKIQVMLQCKFLNKLMVTSQLSNQYKLSKQVSTFFLISMFPEIKLKAYIPLKNFCNFCWHLHINSQGCQTLKNSNLNNGSSFSLESKSMKMWPAHAPWTSWHKGQQWSPVQKKNQCVIPIMHPNLLTMARGFCLNLLQLAYFPLCMAYVVHLIFKF